MSVMLLLHSLSFSGEIALNQREGLHRPQQAKRMINAKKIKYLNKTYLMSQTMMYYQIVGLLVSNELGRFMG
jgi:hypothetical protein